MRAVDRASCGCSCDDVIGCSIVEWVPFWEIEDTKNVIIPINKVLTLFIAKLGEKRVLGAFLVPYLDGIVELLFIHGCGLVTGDLHCLEGVAELE